jgi:glutathione synthase/RimK-type ligase-like ATP-grasp enzyme
MTTLIVVNNKEDFTDSIPGTEVITSRQYITNPRFYEMKGARVINLCRSYVYQSDGYYVSLLAEARGHKIMPDLTTIQDTKTVRIIRILSEDIQQLISKSLADVNIHKFQLDIMFGQTVNPDFKSLGLQLFNQFPAPLLRAFFKQGSSGWKLHDIDPISTRQLNEPEKEKLSSFAGEYLAGKRFNKKRSSHIQYSMAILVNPDELEPPSNKQAIKNFIKAAEALGIQSSTITRDDYNHVAEYDALFIRETTNVHHHTYRFARTAAIKNPVVMDDPDSILKCTNKVYLAELMEKNNIPVPKTIIVHKDNLDELPRMLKFPIILKMPDSCLSQGVHKAKNQEELHRLAKDMFSKSDLIIAQEFMPTEYDWRIGIIDGKPFYACRYYMARNHWQITEWKDGNTRHGNHACFPLSEVPPKVLSTAVKAAGLIGKGLYGVDMKEIKGKPYVIEINDNPSLDAGVEDNLLKDELYRHVMQVFLNRIQNKSADNQEASGNIPEAVTKSKKHKSHAQ